MPKPQSKRSREDAYRSRLIHIHVPTDPETAKKNLGGLSKTLKELSERGFSPTSITGVGKYLFVLIEHEGVIQRRMFAPMAKFFNLMHEFEGDEEDPEETTSTDNSAPSDPIDITARPQQDKNEAAG